MYFSEARRDLRIVSEMNEYAPYGKKNVSRSDAFVAVEIKDAADAYQEPGSSSERTMRPNVSLGMHLAAAFSQNGLWTRVEGTENKIHFRRVWGVPIFSLEIRSHQGLSFYSTVKQLVCVPLHHRN